MSNYLSGPSVLGFWGMFEADYGDPKTPSPYLTVTPTKIGSALLPFHCPHCRAVVDFSDPKQREMYHDTRWWRTWRWGKGSGTVKNKHYWCPACNARFFLDLNGMPLSQPLQPGDVAPSKVEVPTETGSVSALQRSVDTTVVGLARARAGVEVLGCCL